jgi:protein SCO1/2
MTRIRHSRNRSSLALTALVVLALAIAAGPAAAQEPEPAPTGGRMEPLPPELEGVELEQKLGAQVPLSARFKDEDGRAVTLGDYFDGRRPVIITLNYFRCPMLCGLQLNALLNGGDRARLEGRTSGLQGLDWTPGEEFLMLTVSFDPLETPHLAMLKKQGYMEALGRPGAAKGWHFLTGMKPDIQALTEAVGFKYRWNPQRREYAHSVGIVICTPDGKVSQYLTGLDYDSADLDRALRTAGRGETGSVLHDFLVFTCFVYNSKDGSYAADAMKIMRSSGLLIVLVVGGYFLLSWRRSARQRVREAGGTES